MKENTHSRKWEKMNAALKNYSAYLARNKSKPLGLIDLLYISNFKGGNAAVCENEADVDEKLKNYDAVFVKIREKFGEKKLEELESEKVDELCGLAQDVFTLARQKETKIDGFKESYLSALMHAHFPNLLPIIDRRVMVGAGIITEKNKNLHFKSGNQLRDIPEDYPRLIRKSHKDLKEIKEAKNLRELDKYYFARGFPDWMRKK